MTPERHKNVERVYSKDQSAATGFDAFPFRIMARDSYWQDDTNLFSPGAAKQGSEDGMTLERSTNTTRHGLPENKSVVIAAENLPEWYAK